MNKILFGILSLLIFTNICFTNELPDGVTITETNIYVSTVDNLRIREMPELNGKVIGKLMRFEEVEYLDEMSKTETSIEVEGEMKKAPWILIKTKNGVEGWVWRGFAVVINEYIDEIAGFSFKYPKIIEYNGDKLSFSVNREKIVELPNNKEIFNNLGEDYTKENVLKEMKLLTQGKAYIYPRKVTLKNVYMINNKHFINGYFDWWTYVADEFSFKLKIVLYNKNYIVVITTDASIGEMLKAMPELFQIYKIEKNEFETEIINIIKDEKLKDEILRYYEYEEDSQSNNGIAYKYYKIIQDNRYNDINKRIWKIFNSIGYKPKKYYSLLPNEKTDEFYHNLNRYDLRGSAKDWFEGYQYIIHTLEIYN